MRQLFLTLFKDNIMLRGNTIILWVNLDSVIHGSLRIDDLVCVHLEIFLNYPFSVIKMHQFFTTHHNIKLAQSVVIRAYIVISDLCLFSKYKWFAIMWSNLSYFVFSSLWIELNIMEASKIVQPTFPKFDPDLINVAVYVEQYKTYCEIMNISTA